MLDHVVRKYFRRIAYFILFLFFSSPFLWGKSMSVPNLLPDREMAKDTVNPSGSLLMDRDTVTVFGKIRDLEQLPLAGVRVIEQGTLNGTLSDMSGEFSLTVTPSSVLEFSLTGYAPLEVVVHNQLYITITLYEESSLLDSVIVTALGIKRNEVSLSYSALKVDGEEVSRNKDPNMITSLAGKIAGVQVNRSASGLGGSAQVLIRGIRNAVGTNQPLYVIDGIPMINTPLERAYSAIGGTADAGNRDGGDWISDFNPEDVESISVLKGAPAAALYGSEAANGVILITTKKAKANETKVTFSTSLTVDNAFSLPEFQNSYGESDGIESWSERQSMSAYDNAGNFFNTGLTSITSFSLSSGGKQVQSYLSYAYTNVQGIVEKSRLYRHNVTYRATTTMFNDRLKIDGNINLVRQETKDRPVSGGFYMNSLVGLYRFPRGKDLSVYENEYEVYDPSRNLNVQNWHSSTQDFEQNPYWVVNRIRSEDTRSRVIASLTADVQITQNLKIQGRGSVDYGNNKSRQKYYASTAPALAGTNGRYSEYDYNEVRFYGDVMGMYEKRFADFSLNAVLGASISRNTINSTRYDSKTASLYFANVFMLSNIQMNSLAYLFQQIDETVENQSVFATAQVGYLDGLFVDVTARNEWPSSLSFTRHEKRGYFYPSIGAAWIMNRMIDLPKFISLAKVRAALSKMANTMPYGKTNLMATIGAGGEYQAKAAEGGDKLKPESTTAFEVGTEWRFFLDRLGFSFTFYKTNTHDQFFELPSKTGDLTGYRLENAGNIQNSGIEIQFDAIPVRTKDVRWKTSVSLSANRNKVIELHPELEEFIYGPRGFSSSYVMKLRKGGSVGDIYGKAFRRDENGVILYETEGDRKGLPLIDGEDNDVKVGNSQPKCNLGWQNHVRFGLFEAGFLIDCRFGGHILSQTQADMDQFGVTRATAEARDAGGVWLEGHLIEDVKGFYKLVGGRSGVTEYYMYNATNIRLREVSLSYDLPRKLLEISNILKAVRFSLVARNLFFIYKKAPFDPDLVLSTGNDNQGIEIYGMPTTRSMGFTIKCEI